MTIPYKDCRTFIVWLPNGKAFVRHTHGTQAVNASKPYVTGDLPPRYPLPALRTRVEYDYSMLRMGKVIGMQLLEDNRKGCLVGYWPND